MPLGLETSEGISAYWSQNSRRKIFYSYPNGTAPLTGLLSLADSTPTPEPEFGWYEDRWQQLRTTTIAGPTANCVFYITGTTTTAGATFTPAGGTSYRIYLTDASKWQIDDVIKIHYLPLSSGTTEVAFRVTNINTAVALFNFVEAECVSTASGAITNNSASVVGLLVIYAGSAFAEASRSRTGRTKFPSNIKNYTQIFKTAFEMSRTALKAPLVYDKSGDYKNQLKRNGIDHLSGMEWAFLTGDRTSRPTTDEDTGATVRRSYVGGLLWFLKQWEKGSVANGGAFDYRDSAVDVSSQTDFIKYRDKRIIRLGAASVSLDTFNEIEALPFQKVNSTEFCKLCLCGPGYISKVNARYGKEIQKTELREEQFKGFNFQMTQRMGLQGDIYYKQHPLFAMSDSPYYNSAFYIDMGYIKYRPLTDTDTDIQQMIQLPDADKRKDQWLTEAGLELPFPEAHMFVDNLGGITL